MTEQHIQDSSAPLIEHLVELRKRLIWSLIGVGAMMIVCFIFARELFDLLAAPLYGELVEREMVPKLIYTALHEKFFTDLRLSMFGGFFLAFPIVAFQLWRFVAPGLYKNEQSAFWPFLISSPILFFMGGAMVYYVVAPMAFGFFLDYGTAGVEDGVDVSTEFLGKVREYLGLMMTFILAFGFCFQLPVVLTLMGRAGIVSADGLSKGRKYAVVGIAAAAAVLTPPDPISQIGLGVPIYLLYEISIILVRRVEKRRAAREAAEEAELFDEFEDEDEADAEAPQKGQ